jgi:hypothetical protein
MIEDVFFPSFTLLLAGRLARQLRFDRRAAASLLVWIATTDPPIQSLADRDCLLGVETMPGDIGDELRVTPIDDSLGELSASAAPPERGARGE